MSTSIYLVNPRSDFPGYYGAEVFAAQGFGAATSIADLALPTLAAMAPADFDVRLCDESISPADLETDADYVGITGKMNQRARMLQLAREFRRRGKVVIMGGPYASLSPEHLRDACDVLVQGEIEEIAPELFADLRESRWKDAYHGGRPELGSSPVPKWSMYPNHRALIGTIQTSRGCPFECEFCDVIQYLGRKQRHKTPSQVLLELDTLYEQKYRHVFLADDNFTAHRSRAKELLVVLKAWNDARPDGRVLFGTQLSIECAKDPEMLRMCAEAGLSQVFIGIETPNELSLKETKKRQNLGIDLGEYVRRFVAHGIAVCGGMIVGFDSDTPDIFERQYEFGMSLPVPLFSLAALVAPMTTPLYTRLQSTDRLMLESDEIVIATPWDTNIVPMQMTREELLRGVKWLANRLYAPAAFGHRVELFIEQFDGATGGSSAVMTPPQRWRSIDIAGIRLVGKLSRLGPAEAEMLACVSARVARNPTAGPFVTYMLAQYMQVRHMYDLGGLWNPQLASLPRPM
jgi:hypothetical protein